MRFLMFLTVACLALVTAAGSQIDLLARCRCDRPARGERKAARQERRSARRGYASGYSVTPATPSNNPYDSGVQPLGAAEQPRFRWQCDGRSCRLVPVNPQTKAADCPPPTAPTKTPEPAKEETQETGVIEPPAFENLPDPIQAESDPPPARPVDPTTAWQPDPQAKLPGWDD